MSTQPWLTQRVRIYWYDQYALNDQETAFSKYDPERIADELTATTADIIAVYAANQFSIAYYPSQVWPQHPNLKGRDYFDLLWYLQKGILPNISCIEGVKDMKELKEKLLAMVASVDSKSIQLDLEALISSPGFVDNVSRNMKAILEREISEKL